MSNRDFEVSIDVNVSEIFDSLHPPAQEEILINHLDIIDINKIIKEIGPFKLLDIIGIEDITAYLEYEGYVLNAIE